MRLTLFAHILAGSLGLLSGYVALYASKGGTAHRRSGQVFVCVMLAMAVSGMLISAVNNVAPGINVPSALLTVYLVVTGLTTVRPPAASMRSLDTAAMVMAFALGLGCFVTAAVAIGNGAAAGMAYPLVMFGAVAIAGGSGDRRVLRSGPLKGSPRLKRHLWRMCIALFVPSIAFFMGPVRLPEALRIPALRAAGVLLPLVAIVYWRWRLRSTRAAVNRANLTAVGFQ